MGEALALGYDLGGIAACYVAIALLVLAAFVIDKVAAVFNVSILGAHPFGGIANALHNRVVGALNSAIQGLEQQATRFESGLVDAFTLLVGIPLLLVVGIKDALVYLWNTAFRAFVHTITDPVRTIATNAATAVGSLADTVANDVSKVEHYADGAATGALSSAKAYADHWIDNAVSVLNGNIRAAQAAAESYADTAVGKLRAAESSAIAEAVSAAAEAKAAGVAAAAGALATAEGEIGAAKNAAIAAAAGALSTAESYADAVGAGAIAAVAGALTTAEQYADAKVAAAAAAAAGAAAEAESIGQQALAAVRSVAIDLGGELGTIEGGYGAAGVAGLIASIPLVATFVNTLASESGLDSTDCRQKVKGICRTPASLWEELLGGLVAFGFAFSLLELAEVADPILVKLAPIIADAA